MEDGSGRVRTARATVGEKAASDSRGRRGSQVLPQTRSRSQRRTEGASSEGAACETDCCRAPAAGDAGGRTASRAMSGSGHPDADTSITAGRLPFPHRAGVATLVANLNGGSDFTAQANWLEEQFLDALEEQSIYLPIPFQTTPSCRETLPCFKQGNGLLLPALFNHLPECRACLDGNVLPILTLDSNEEHGRLPMASNDDSISLGDFYTFPDPFLQVPYRDRLQRISSSVLWGGLSRTLRTYTFLSSSLTS